jgi:cyclopropane fatty-acyl-phospholipid synthase-like methyltransferase
MFLTFDRYTPRRNPLQPFGAPLRVACAYRPDETSFDDFGQDYAKTLATWRNNFRIAWPNLVPLGFDDRFRSLWEYYLSCCRAGFRSGNIDVRQIVFAKAN